MSVKTFFIKLFTKINSHILELGILLLFLLPPIGIGCLLVTGWYHIYKIIRKKATLYINLSTIFFLSLLLASIGALIEFHQWKYILVPLMILGYLGLYLHVKDHGKLSSMRTYKQKVIWGSIYIFIVGQIQLFGDTFYSSTGVLGMLTGSLLLGYDKPDRLFGSAYNPNFASFLLLFALAFLLVDLLNQLRKGFSKKTILSVGMIAAIAVAVAETGSRTGVVCMIVLFLLFSFRYRWVFGGASLCLLTFIGENKISELLPRTQNIGESAYTRKVIWENSVHIWYNHPFFGVTPIGFKDAYAQLAEGGITHAHNIVLGFFSEYGTIGGLTFIFLVICTFYKLSKAALALKNQKRYLDLFLFTMPIILITGIFDHPLVSPQTALPAIILLGSWDRYSSRVRFFAKPAMAVRKYS
ncbi:O-antigen ligase family protein [Aneurinibacillus terranovensis]|uniref:O-antigen ligase family protein n=1 Tax=Aneurinibacillus terranovensis TaxID=278991 RepID=UPI0003FB8E46|nr:O-antigen ligase family protein [Aneurinibacillus terranovensis]